MWLNELWFVLIAVLWIGFFVLEGFDFGVGGLLPFLGKDERGKRTMINTIGPVWDGNEVWLITAGGAMFAAVPEWYATLFSGFYLPLLLILVALIVRGVAFEYRHKGTTQRWRDNWTRAITICSWVPALLFGVAFGNFVAGVPIEEINGNLEYTGGFFNLLNPFALLMGLTTLSLFLTHGAIFLALKTRGEMRARAKGAVAKLAPVALGVMVITLVWQQFQRTSTVALVLAVLAPVALLAAWLIDRAGRDGWAFVLSAVSTVALVAGWFAALHPAVMPSSVDPAFDLTLVNAASSPYTLTLMSWVALALIPFVLAYQAWTYWVFRKRLSVRQIPLPADKPAPSPAR